MTQSRLSQSLVGEDELREELLGFVEKEHWSNIGHLVIQELGLRHGLSRVDVAVVSDVIHGYEIKSDYDKLDRLADQVKIYGQVLDRATLVVGGKHLEAATKLIPGWWGLVLGFRTFRGEVELVSIRAHKQNPSQDTRALSELLWRDEALKSLEMCSAADSLRSSPRRHIYEKLASVLPQDHLRSVVVTALISREDWRSA